MALYIGCEHTEFNLKEIFLLLTEILLDGAGD